MTGLLKRGMLYVTQAGLNSPIPCCITPSGRITCVFTKPRYILILSEGFRIRNNPDTFAIFLVVTAWSLFGCGMRMKLYAL